VEERQGRRKKKPTTAGKKKWKKNTFCCCWCALLWLRVLVLGRRNTPICRKIASVTAGMVAFSPHHSAMGGVLQPANTPSIWVTSFFFWSY